MIILDTHIWIWWVDNSESLTPKQRQFIQTNQDDFLGISAISCWEVAKLVELGRLRLSYPVKDWLIQALRLTPEVAVESTQLPGNFHRDPADQIIVATARIFDCPLLTADSKILDYNHVKKLVED